jgi:dual specificity phosphatase 12
VALQAANITHVVSVLRYDFKDFKDWEQYEHCSVQVDDVEDENLLGEFARTGKFIKEGLQGGGGVLVHW